MQLKTKKSNDFYNLLKIQHAILTSFLYELIPLPDTEK